MRDWDAHFMSKALLNGEMSTCRTRKVGAVAVINRRQIADGFNGNLPGAKHCTDGGCGRCQNRAFAGDDIMRCVCVHAEQNIVVWCARVGLSLDGATLYTTTHPCADCLKLVFSAGVAEVVYGEPYAEGQRMAMLLGVSDRIRKF